MEFLILATQTTSKEASTQTKKHVGENRTQDSVSNDAYVGVAARLDQYHEENDLDDGTKGCFHHHTSYLRYLTCKLLARETDQIRCRNHGNIVENKDGKVPFRAGKMLNKALVFGQVVFW